MTYRVAIIGDGQMGLVLADALVERGMDVSIWGPFKDYIDTLRDTRKSSRLPSFSLSDSVDVSIDGGQVLEGADVAINAIPTQFIRTVWTGIQSNVPVDIPIGCVAKGIEVDTQMLPTQILQEVVGDSYSVCVLSGPTIAKTPQ